MGTEIEYPLDTPVVGILYFVTPAKRRTHALLVNVASELDSNDFKVTLNSVTPTPQ